MASPLLSYDYGNQAVRSRVTISKTGKLEHLEVVDTVVVKTERRQLNKTELKDLKARIEGAKVAKLATVKGGVTAMGSSAGDFFVKDSTGKRVTIETVTRNPNPTGPEARDIIEVNRSVNARRIYDFVISITEQDMPKK